MRRFLFVVILLFLVNSLGAQSLKVMTYNIRLNTKADSVNAWPLRKADVFELLNKYDPDVLGVQEALDGQMVDLAEELTEYEYIGVGRDDGKRKGEFSAIFFRKDRFKVEKRGTFWLSETPRVPGSKSWDAAITRVATYAVLKDKGNRRYFVLNTHFDHMGSEARYHSAELIVSRVKTLAGKLPVIVMGDLNCTRDEKPYEVFKSTTEIKLIDPAPSDPPGTYCTFKAGVPCRAIDYIFHNELLTATNYSVLDDNDGTYYPSDHLPVMVVLAPVK